MFIDQKTEKWMINSCEFSWSSVTAHLYRSQERLVLRCQSVAWAFKSMLDSRLNWLGERSVLLQLTVCGDWCWMSKSASFWMQVLPSADSIQPSLLTTHDLTSLMPGCCTSGCRVLWHRDCILTTACIHHMPSWTCTKTSCRVQNCTLPFSLQTWKLVSLLAHSNISVMAGSPITLLEV